MKKNFKSILMLVLAVAIVISLVSLFNNKGNGEKLIYSDVVTMFNDDIVTSFTMDAEGNMTIKAYKIETDKDGNKILETDVDSDGVYDDGDAYKFAVDKNGEKVVETYQYTLQSTILVEEINALAKVKIPCKEHFVIFQSSILVVRIFALNRIRRAY